MANKFTNEYLEELRSLSLIEKIYSSKTRIIEWYQYFNGNVYVSFSGGKDSTVLLHLVRSIFPEVPAVFFNTGLEFPELVNFVKEKDNINILKPEKSFYQVITKYGYPLITKKISEYIRQARRIVHKGESRYPTQRRLALLGKEPNHSIKDMAIEDFNQLEKNELSAFNIKKWLPIARELPVMISEQCCNEMKKKVAKKYTKENFSHPYVGNLTEESRNRKMTWFKNGCNAYEGKEPVSTPLAFWTEQDILQYIYENKIDIASVYGEVKKENEKYLCSGYTRTGCIFCAFGTHLEKDETRFQLLAKTHPKLYDYCIKGGKWIDNPKYEPDASMEPDELGWINWNPKKIYIPGNGGLGFGKVFDMCNDIMGEEIYRY